MAEVTYTTKGQIDFGNKFKGKYINDILRSVKGRNYMIWMMEQGFKMSAQLFKIVDGHKKANVAKNGYIYEADPENYKDDGIDDAQDDSDRDRGYLHGY